MSNSQNLVKHRLQIAFIILSKLIKFHFPGNYQKRFLMVGWKIIRLNSVNIRSKVWRRSLIITAPVFFPLCCCFHSTEITIFSNPFNWRIQNPVKHLRWPGSEHTSVFYSSDSWKALHFHLFPNPELHHFSIEKWKSLIRKDYLCE